MHRAAGWQRSQITPVQPDRTGAAMSGCLLHSQTLADFDSKASFTASSMTSCSPSVSIFACLLRGSSVAKVALARPSRMTSFAAENTLGSQGDLLHCIDKTSPHMIAIEYAAEIFYNPQK